MRIPRTVPTLAPALVVTALLCGCATTVCIPPAGNPNLTPAQVAATGGHTGERLRWGGALASARNLADSTELEVVAFPLDRCGQPRAQSQPIGRFILIKPGYLETAEHPPGSRLSATGLVVGIREGQVGSAPYRFPLLQAGDLHWWAKEEQSGGYAKPWVTIGIGGGSGGVGGGIGVLF